ncbi:MAG: rhodanese-like domain-containing protein [Pseudomonadota bacterium]
MSDIQSISAKEAWNLMQEKPQTILVDVRSSMEYLFVGHPTGAVHIAWIDEPDWKVNPHFITQVRQLVLGGVIHEDEDSGVPVLLICRSGKRSLEAAHALITDGLTDIYNVEGGFEGPLDEHHHRSTLTGWRHAGLPWEQC